MSDLFFKYWTLDAYRYIMGNSDKNLFSLFFRFCAFIVAGIFTGIHDFLLGIWNTASPSYNVILGIIMIIIMSLLISLIENKEEEISIEKINELKNTSIAFCILSILLIIGEAYFMLNIHTFTSKGDNKHPTLIDLMKKGYKELKLEKQGNGLILVNNPINTNYVKYIKLIDENKTLINLLYGSKIITIVIPFIIFAISVSISSIISEHITKNKVEDKIVNIQSLTNKLKPLAYSYFGIIILYFLICSLFIFLMYKGTEASESVPDNLREKSSFSTKRRKIIKKNVIRKRN